MESLTTIWPSLSVMRILILVPTGTCSSVERHWTELPVQPSFCETTVLLRMICERYLVSRGLIHRVFRSQSRP